MDGRGSLRQLHQQLAGANYAATAAGSMYSTQDWANGLDRHRTAPPLPTLPPWAANPLSDSTQHMPHRQQQQPQFAPTAFASRALAGSHSRDEIDLASSPGSKMYVGDHDDGVPSALPSQLPVSGWRKAPSYFGSMKRLPVSSNSSADPAALHRAPLPLVRQQHLPGLSECQLGESSANDDNDRDSRERETTHFEREFDRYEPRQQQQVGTRFPSLSIARNQQLEAEDSRADTVPMLPNVHLSSRLSPLELDRLQQPQQDETMMQKPSARRPATPAVDLTFSEPANDEMTNQTEEHEHQRSHALDADLSSAASIVQQSGFFRPWKKCPPADDGPDVDNNNNNNNNSSSSSSSSTSCDFGGASPQVNKWKVRALLNPFARRSRPTSLAPTSLAPTSLAPTSLAPTSFPVPTNDDSSRSGDRGASQELVRRGESLPPPRASTPSVSSSPILTTGAPRRPTTPVPAPSALSGSARLSSPSLGALRPRSQHAHDRNSGLDVPPGASESSNDGVSAALERRAVAQQSFRRRPPVLVAPSQSDTPSQSTASYNREARESFASFQTPAPKAPRAGAPNAARSNAKPLPQSESQSQLQQQTPASAAQPQEAFKVQRDASAKPKPKSSGGAVLTALAEIQRKRDARRALQADAKQRMQTELEMHGDDTGYKFRRLVQLYRDALPAFQRQQPQEQAPSHSTELSLSHVATTALAPSRLSVYVRKRPLSKRECKSKDYDVVSCLFATAPSPSLSQSSGLSLREQLVLHEPKRTVDCSEALEHHAFGFDGVFDEQQDSAQVYRCSVGPLLPLLVPDDALAQRHINNSHTTLTVFAYGQTGSGKTFTMQSIYRQAAADVFARIAVCTDRPTDPESPSASSPILVGVSFYEIYMNSVLDLLNRRRRVQLLEDGDGTVQLLGLKEVTIASADELLALVQHGEDARATSANAVHADSSRSHALLRVTLYTAPGSNTSNTSDTSNTSSSNATTLLARLSMVDLAGSERACDTQSDSKSTRREGAEINKSLLALKECVRALDRGAAHVPFRQSKLTQLLRDSFLGARAQTVMIATVSPGAASASHTLNTLRYADRLKEIGTSVG